MRETKRKFLFLQIYDHTGIKKRLEEMAEEGWKLEKIGEMGAYKFRRMTPKQLRYSVVYFPEASEFDPEPGVRQREFIELCEQSGWEYIDSTAQMLVFCTECVNPIPIETDAQMQVETVHKAMKKSFLPGQFVLLGLAILQLLMFGYRIATETVNVLLQNALLVSLICYLLIFVLCAHHITEYYLWRRKATATAADDIFVETKGHNWLEKIVLIVVAAVFVFWLSSMLGDAHSLYIVGYSFAVMGIYIAVIFAAKALMKKLKASRETNRIVTFGSVVVGTVLVIIVLGHGVMNTNIGENDVDIPDNVVGTYEHKGSTRYVYDDPIPLTLEMLGIDDDYDDRSRVHDTLSSAMMTVYNGQEIAPWGTEGLPELDYTLTIPKFGFLMELCVEDVLDDRRIRNLYGDSREIDSSAWQAERVYEYILDGQCSGRYTVIWHDRILEISLPELPTDAQIAVIVDCLRTYEP